MVLKNINLDVGIPQGVSVHIVGSLVEISGPKGNIKRDFYHPKIVIKTEGNLIKVEGKKLNSKEKMIVPTFKAIIQNNVKGVVNPYVYELKICSGHFPIKVGVEGKQLVVRNLLGEKVPRAVEIPLNVKVNVSGNVVNVESPDKSLAGQTAVSIEKITIRPGFDKRVFQDGIYITKKAN